MRLRAAVLGDAVVDVHVSGAAPRPGADVPAAVRLEPGGQGANLAVRLARRGVQVRLSCAVGHDAAGRLLHERLTAEGIDVMAAPAERTGAVVVLVAADGDRSMLSQRVPLGAALDAEWLTGLAAGVDWLAVSGYVLLEPPAQRLATAVAATPARRVVLGCALTPAEAPGWRAAVRDCRPTLVVLNADEAATLTATVDASDAATRLAGDLDATVVVTHSGGAVAVVDGMRLAASASREEDAVDTTGAGDAFVAALIATLGHDVLTGSTLDAALDAAVAAGTAATRVVGAQGRIAGEPIPDTLTP